MATKKTDEKALAAVENKAVAPQSTALWTNAQAQIIAQVMFKDHINNDMELRLFMNVCQRTGLDPFRRQIYAIKRQGKLSFQTSIDGYRVIAQRSGQYGGIEPWKWLDDEGEEYTFWNEADPPMAARVTVHRNDWATPVTATAMFREFAQYKDGRPTAMWAKMPSHMIAKCAEALAIRQAFPEDTAGIYIHEEMGTVIDGEGTVVDPGTPAGIPIEGSATPSVPEGEQEPPEEWPEGEYDPEYDQDPLAPDVRDGSDSAPSKDVPETEPTSSPTAQASEPTGPVLYGSEQLTLDQIKAKLKTRASANKALTYPGSFLPSLPADVEGGLDAKLRAYCEANIEIPIVATLEGDAIERLAAPDEGQGSLV